MNIFNELPTAFPWYDNVKKQNRFRENAANVKDVELIAPNNALLPFEFYKTGAATVTEWIILNLSGAAVTTISGGDLTKIRTVTKAGRVYFYYNGSALTGLSLPAGKYYSRVALSDGAFFYSETFVIPECSFSSTDTVNTDFLKLEWWNETDLPPIFYNDFTATVPYFKNVVYLDTFVHVSDPEIIEDGEKDGNDEVVPTFSKAILRYRITELVPDYLKLALVIMQMHDHVILTTRKGLRSGEIYKLTTNTNTEFGGAYSTIEIIFEESVAMIKKGCGDNMT